MPSHKYPAESVLSTLLDKVIPAHKICSKRPLNITRSATYVVDVSKLAHPDDVKKDSFGIWKHSGSHTLCSKSLCADDDGNVDVEKCAPGASRDNIVLLRRLHSTQPSNKEFKRMILFLRGKCKPEIPYSVRYGFLILHDKSDTNIADSLYSNHTFHCRCF